MGNEVKIQISGDCGKISLKLEGNAATAESLVQVVNSLKPLLSNEPRQKTADAPENMSIESLDNLSIKERVKRLIRSALKHGWFNSKDILELYQHYMDENIALSTISTYLARLAKEEVLERRGSRSNLEYRMKSAMLEIIPEIELTPQI